MIAATDHTLVTEWMDGTPLSRIISDGTQEQRNRAGILLVRLMFSAPSRARAAARGPASGQLPAAR